jgi:choline kinase
MGDHIFDKSILKDMKYKNLDNVDIILAVDYNIHENRFVDIDDVTKVFVVDNMILDIGKDITQFNAYDTGIFLCSPNIFSAIEESINLNGDGTLSAAVRTLANKRRAGVFDIKDNFWIDIDNEQQLMKAEDMLMSLTKKQSNYLKKVMNNVRSQK